MLSDKVNLRVLKSGNLTATESLVDAIPRATFQSLVFAIGMSAPEAATVQLLIKNNPVGAAPNAATADLRSSVRVIDKNGKQVAQGTEISDAAGLIAVPVTDSCMIEMTLPSMLMARSESFSVGIKTAAAPTGTPTYVAMLAQDR